MDEQIQVDDVDRLIYENLQLKLMIIQQKIELVTHYLEKKYNVRIGSSHRLSSDYQYLVRIVD